MTQSSHTEGLWSFNRAIHPDNTGGYDYAIEHDGQIIAEVFQHTGWQDNSKKEYVVQPAEANARLISASPDLLEALEDLTNWHETNCGNMALKKLFIENAWNAIEKARGA